MQLNPYLSFDGNCEEAFEFYKKCLGGEIVAMIRFGETPASEFVPAESHDRIMHARLVVGDQVLMGVDSRPDDPYQGVKGCQVSINVSDPADAERIFGALSENGTPVMPMQETFWAVRFGMFVDRYGVPWMVNSERPA
jgi:PhnB protein